MAIHSSTLAWKIPWMEEPDRLQSMGSKESNTTERLPFSHDDGVTVTEALVHSHLSVYRKHLPPRRFEYYLLYFGIQITFSDYYIWKRCSHYKTGSLYMSVNHHLIFSKPQLFD